MTALKRTVRTRRGVEPTGRPARREVELGKKSTNFVQDGARALVGPARTRVVGHGRHRRPASRR